MPMAIRQPKVLAVKGRPGIAVLADEVSAMPKKSGPMPSASVTNAPSSVCTAPCWLGEAIEDTRLATAEGAVTPKPIKTETA